MNDRSPYRRLTNRVLAGFILLCAGVYCTGCGTISRTLSLPFKAVGAGVETAEKMLSNPAKMIDKALDTSSRAGGTGNWLGQIDTAEGIPIHSVPIAYETRIQPPHPTGSESS